MKAELLAPAGNLAKLKLAIYYGADAVYLGGKLFSLRNFSENFTDEELEEGIGYAHAHGKKAYVCANIFARNADLPSSFAFLSRSLSFSPIPARTRQSLAKACRDIVAQRKSEQLKLLKNYRKQRQILVVTIPRNVDAV